MAIRFCEAVKKTPDHIVGGRVINPLSKNLYASTSQLILDIVYQNYNAAPNQAYFLGSANLAVPCQRFRELGGFNPDFRTSEDRELCDHWLHNGLKMTYVPEAIVYHAHNLNFFTFCKQHFGYGRGAHRFHKMRESRGSGKFQTEFKFHLNFRNWLLYPFTQANDTRAITLAALLVVWQVVNTVGFCWEAMAQRWKKLKVLLVRKVDGI